MDSTNPGARRRWWVALEWECAGKRLSDGRWIDGGDRGAVADVLLRIRTMLRDAAASGGCRGFSVTTHYEPDCDHDLDGQEVGHA